MEWDNLTIDTDLGDINVETVGGGALGIKGCGASLGNSTNTITVFLNSELAFGARLRTTALRQELLHVMTNAIAGLPPANGRRLLQCS